MHTVQIIWTHQVITAVTYKVTMADIEGTGVFYYNRSVGHSNSYSYEMGISWITVMEVVV